MKNIIVLLLMIAPFSFSQRQTIFEGDIDNGVMGAVGVKYTQINKKDAVLVGGEAGWLINHQFLLGAAGYGLVNNIRGGKVVEDYYPRLHDPLVTFGYGGGLLQYYFAPESRVHSSVSLLIGAGGVAYRSNTDRDYNFKDWDYDYYNDRDNTKAVAFFVLEPGVSAEFNFTKFFKVGINASYRYIGDVDIVGLKNTDLSNFSGGIALKFGIF